MQLLPLKIVNGETTFVVGPVGEMKEFSKGEYSEPVYGQVPHEKD